MQLLAEESVVDESERAWIGLDEAELRLELYLYHRLQQDPPDSQLYWCSVHCWHGLRMSGTAELFY